MITTLAVSAVNGKVVKETLTRAAVKTGVMLGANITAYTVNNAMLNKMSEEDRRNPDKMKKFKRNSLIRSAVVIGCAAAVADTLLSSFDATTDDSTSSEIS